MVSDFKAGSPLFLLMAAQMAAVCWIALLMKERDKQNEAARE